ncbi:YjbQ family protein [Clostridium sp. 19966]|uniref:secondary thiamine-phosphate synthase enzyme YjbQ n=1 Tax=Clostridium sp. 19966 TaxID=2768166 RepID=UPI0028DDCA54|nr:secondary thiamine-phosphate synthase enzyme YjbQ [Clostridium sp. 19966]MDT8719487.1 YjbQ family protein [Clostridium sp. 19966]
MSSKIYDFQIQTKKSDEFINITNDINNIIGKNEIKDGLAIIFCPHTTAGITINENADPDVVRDIIYGLDKIYPVHGDYKHFEGNSHAHLKASTFGFSQTLIISNGKLLLGTWQGIYFCEFDGPRIRKVHIKIISC